MAHARAVKRVPFEESGEDRFSYQAVLAAELQHLVGDDERQADAHPDHHDEGVKEGDAPDNGQIAGHLASEASARKG